MRGVQVRLELNIYTRHFDCCGLNATTTPGCIKPQKVVGVSGAVASTEAQIVQFSACIVLAFIVLEANVTLRS